MRKNLVSDIPQPNNADGSAVLLDPNLKNPWGITRSSSGSPWWVSNNNSGTSTLYDGGGNPISGRECRLIRFQVMRLSRK